MIQGRRIQELNNNIIGFLFMRKFEINKEGVGS